YEELAGVNSGLVVKAGEIINVRLQNGGGYGDPVGRDPEAVLRDVRTGAVSSDVAERIYGVIVAGEALDAAATERRRDEIREARRAAMRPPAGGGSAESGAAAGAAP